MKIVICGSRRFEEGIRRIGKKLKDNGHIVLEPFLNKNTEISNLSPDLKKYAFLGLTHHHFEFIRKADVGLMYNQEGYLGNSSTMELGFAIACGLPIYALQEDTDEACRNVLFDFLVTEDEFVQIANQNR